MWVGVRIVLIVIKKVELGFILRDNKAIELSAINISTYLERLAHDALDKEFNQKLNGRYMCK